MGKIFGNNFRTDCKALNGDDNPVIRIDLADDDDYYYLYADVPGKQINDIKMKFKSGDKLSLRIIEETGNSNPISNKTCIWQERNHEEVERIIEFDEPINKENISARLENGLLIVEIAKKDSNDDDDENLIVIKS